MSGFFEALFKFFSEFTWRKLLAVMVVIAVVFGALSLYERYTSSLRLSRLQKATDLLVRLQDIQARATNSNPELDRARMTLIAQVVLAIEEKPMTLDFIPSRLTFQVDGLWKFIAGSALWWVFVLFQLPKLKAKESRTAIQGMLMLAGISGFFGIFVPAVWWPWFHLLIYPWLFIAVVVSALVPFALVAGRRSAKAKALRISCANNLKQVGVAARIWAAEHGAVLPPDFASMNTQLGNERVTLCPAGANERFEILSPGASALDPTVVYARCPTHNTVVFVDGSAHELGKRSLLQKDGKWRIGT